MKDLAQEKYEEKNKIPVYIWAVIIVVAILTFIKLISENVSLKQKKGGHRPPTLILPYSHTPTLVLLSLMLLRHLLNLLFHGLQVKGSRILHRRIVDRRHSQFGNCILNIYKAPEFTGIEIVHITAGRGYLDFLRE